MGKTADSQAVKAKRYVNQFPKEFTCNFQNELFCQLCATIVKCDKRFYVEQHRETAKHQRKVAPEQPQASNSQSFLLPQSQKDFTKQVVTAFLEADIPLYKLQHSSIKNLFNSTLGHHCPSESAYRKQVNDLANQESEHIRKLLTRKPIFLVANESDVSGQKHVNVLAGLMEEPNKAYLIACSLLSGNPNSSNICTIVDDCLKEIGITPEMFLLLLSDAAKYMLKAGDTLKIMYQCLLHVTCTAHLLHNSAEHIRAHFKAANNLISSIKAATIKNKDRCSLFTAAGFSAPPQPILTRWGTWLKAPFFYGENFQIVKQIISSFEDGEKLVERAKEAIADQDVFSELRQIFSSYREIAVLIKDIANTSNTVVAAVEAIQNLCLMTTRAK